MKANSNLAANKNYPLKIDGNDFYLPQFTFSKENLFKKQFLIPHSLDSRLPAIKYEL